MARKRTLAEPQIDSAATAGIRRKVSDKLNLAHLLGNLVRLGIKAQKSPVAAGEAMNPLVVGPPPTTLESIIAQFPSAGLPVLPYRIDPGAFARYVAEAPYPARYREDFGPYFLEKAIEHWVSLDLVGGERIARGIDIASASSPFPDIVHARTGRPMYRQDLDYPPGIEGWTVGGSAAALPFPDRSFDAMTLHCSFEHFEGTADTGLITEAARVLRPGGRLCILPLYVADVFANMTDPAVERNGLRWDDDATVYEVAGWRTRFGRFYDVGHLRSRILEPARRQFAVTVHDVENGREIDAASYLRFVLMLERRPDRL